MCLSAQMQEATMWLQITDVLLAKQATEVPLGPSASPVPFKDCRWALCHSNRIDRKLAVYAGVIHKMY